MAYYWGSDFKKTDKKRGRLLIGASVSAGCAMAVAQCHFWGWNGLEEDDKKAFDMCVTIEQKTNGYHWAQYKMGDCCFSGGGTEAFEWYTKSAAQGNSAAMHQLAFCYRYGFGCDKNNNTAVEMV